MQSFRVRLCQGCFIVGLNVSTCFPATLVYLFGLRVSYMQIGQLVFFLFLVDVTLNLKATRTCSHQLETCSSFKTMTIKTELLRAVGLNYANLLDHASIFEWITRSNESFVAELLVCLALIQTFYRCICIFSTAQLEAAEVSIKWNLLLSVTDTPEWHFQRL